MNEQQRIRQAQACHIRFKELIARGHVPSAVTVYDYAAHVLGVRVDSLKELKDWELNALRDRLEGKENKILLKLHDLAAAGGIRDLAGWMRHMAERDAFAYLRGYTPETLPADLQWRLAKCLETRRPGRKAASINKEEPQALLF